MLLQNYSRHLCVHSLVLAFLFGFSLSLPAPALAQQAVGCPTGTAAYWNLNETSGSNFDDWVGGNDATCTTCPTADEGQNDGGQSFSRTSATEMNVEGVAFNWGRSDSFSVELWMKKSGECTDGTVSANEVLVGRDHAASPFHWWLGIDCHAASPKGVAAFKFGDIGVPANFFSVIDDRDLTDGNWHHLVAERDGVSKRILLYVDGELVGSEDAAYSGEIAASDTNLNIGWLNLDGSTFRFSGNLDEVAIYTSVLPEKTVRSHYYLTKSYCSSCEEAVKIMPLGDSITVGNDAGRDSATNEHDTSNWISYRRDLWWGLEADGFSVDFVGSGSSGSAVSPSFDGNHEGHGGYSTSNILNGMNGDLDGIDNWLEDLESQGLLPDVVLLHIGTNDVSQMANAGDIPQAIQNLGEILDTIYTFNGNTTVVLGKIIKRSCDASTMSEEEFAACLTANDLVPGYNAAIDTMLGDRKAGGKADKVIIVDMENGAGIDYARQTNGGDLWDDKHPYDSGFVKMAALWREKLRTFLPVCLASEPVITSPDTVQVSVNQELNYTATATGIPAPTFRLGTTIQGMDINATTGAIAWTPGATGHYTATVIAENDVDEDEKTIDIFVTEASICPTGMTSCWKLDETQSGTYEDSIGSLDGSCSGECPEYIDGKAAGAQTFDGTTTGISVSADASFNWASDASFTIEYWMSKTEATDCDGNQVIVGRADPSATYDTGLHWWTGCYDDGMAAFQLRDKVGNGVLLRGTSTSLLGGQWHHIVAVRDAAHNKNLLYVDGALEDSETWSYADGFDHSTASLNIGHFNTDYRFEGKVDEVALYDRALDAEEVLDHFQRDSLGYCDVSPTIYQHPQDQNVSGGQTVTFTVVAGGSSTLSYQWQRGGVDIQGANSATYTTLPTTAGDDNTSYRCRVTNEYNLQKTSNAATLRVNVPPVNIPPAITAQPVSQSILEGQTATFVVAATGTAPLTYQWQKNGGGIEGATSASYTTPEATASDHGATYRCVVKNGNMGEVVSDTATLTVSPSGISFRQQPKNAAVTEGRRAKFRVAAKGPRGSKLTYQWADASGLAVSGATRNSYTISGVSLGDSGKFFSCVVSARSKSGELLGSVRSLPAVLTVNPSKVRK